jgi:hypothetical protein
VAVALHININKCISKFPQIQTEQSNIEFKTITVTRIHSGTDSSWHSVVELVALQNLPRGFVGNADHICRNTR